ncbi:hypothetical protein GCM10023349_14880 [Nocardioides conyzicola]|uniref:Uncharacterized protein n=1 Tax=Nocardioides conyzicola TaxID=1651781 RepID=A0ABP8X4B9_9ACTN
MVSRQQRDEWELSNRLHFDVRTGLDWRGRDDKVDTALTQIVDWVTQAIPCSHDHEVVLRMPFAEDADQMRKVKDIRGRRKPNPDSASQFGQGAFCRRAVHSLVRRDQRPRLGENPLTVFGQGDSSGCAIEQRHAELAFQTPQGGRHGRLRGTQTLRGTCHAQFLGDDNEVLDRANVH